MIGDGARFRERHTHTPYTVRYDIYDVLINGFVAPCVQSFPRINYIPREL